MYILPVFYYDCSVLDHMDKVASTMAGRGLDFKLKEGLSAETSGYKC